MVSRTGINKKWLLEDILQWLSFPAEEIFTYGYGFPYGNTIKTTGTGRYCERIWFLVLKEIRNEYGKIYYSCYRFPYWKKLNRGAGSHT